MAWGEDFGGDEETLISQAFDRPVLVHRYPRQCKAFYMEANPENPELALCVDMLAPEGYGEIIGGSQRVADLETLLARLEEHHLPREPLEWYLDLRRYGSVPHSGFGLGVERLVAWLCGLKHVRETNCSVNIFIAVWRSILGIRSEPRRRRGKLLILRLTPRGLRRLRLDTARSSRISSNTASWNAALSPGGNSGKADEVCGE